VFAVPHWFLLYRDLCDPVFTCLLFVFTPQARTLERARRHVCSALLVPPVLTRLPPRVEQASTALQEVGTYYWGVVYRQGKVNVE